MGEGRKRNIFNAASIKSVTGERLTDGRLRHHVEEFHAPLHESEISTLGQASTGRVNLKRRAEVAVRGRP
jgi:hypothetical protein